MKTGSQRVVCRCRLCRVMIKAKSSLWVSYPGTGKVPLGGWVSRLQGGYVCPLYTFFCRMSEGKGKGKGREEEGKGEGRDGGGRGRGRVRANGLWMDGQRNGGKSGVRERE